MMSTMNLIVGCIVGVQHVVGHGFMQSPVPRHTSHGPFKYEPQSLGAVGPGGDVTICGRAGAINFNRQDAVTKFPKPGSIYEFEAKITAHHYGHMIVRVCKFIDSGTKKADLKNCIRLTDVKGEDTWKLSSGPGLNKWKAKLPSKAQLAALGKNKYKGVYTIQWRWNTGNSCQPSNHPEDVSSNCNEWKCCSEVFTNCADVVFAGVDHDAPKQVENPPEAAPDLPPVSGGGAGGAGGAACVRDPSEKNPWRRDKSMIGWCAKILSPTECEDQQQCTWDADSDEPESGDQKAEPEPEPEEQSEADIPHQVDVTRVAMKFKLVKEFCEANKAYFCSHKPSPRIGNEICECSPVDTSGQGPRPQTKASATASATTVDCDDHKTWCRDKACQGKVQTNQCWGSPQYKECRCTDGTQHEYDGSLLQSQDKRTKFSDRITRQIGAHGEVKP